MNLVHSNHINTRHTHTNLPKTNSMLYFTQNPLKRTMKVFLCALFLPIFLIATISTEDNFDYCTELKNNTDDTQILSACITNTKFYLLIMKISTKDIYVFENSRAQVESNPEEISLEHKELMSTKWPKLWNYPNFVRWLKEDPRHVVYSFPTSKFTLLVFDWYAEVETKKRATYFNLETLEVNITDIKPAIKNYFEYSDFSTDEPRRYYQFVQDPKLGLTYRFTMKYEGDDDKFSKSINSVGDYSNFCRDSNEDGKAKVFFTSKNVACTSNGGKPVKWPLLRGFVLKGRFYYFSGDRLLLFNKLPPAEESTPTDLKVIRLKKLFQCKAVVIPVKKSYNWVIILAIVLVLLLLTLCLILFCVYQYAGRKKKRKSKAEPFMPDAIRSWLSAAPPGKLDKVPGGGASDYGGARGMQSLRSGLNKTSSLTKSRTPNASGMQSRRSGLSQAGSSAANGKSNMVSGRSNLGSKASRKNSSKSSFSKSSSKAAGVTGRSFLSKQN